MSIFGLVRVEMKKEKIDADIEELKLKKAKKKDKPILSIPDYVGQEKVRKKA